MPSFIESCRCNGARPAGIVGHRFTSRPGIIGRLLRDRHVARFIVAPTGFGKSTVAFEYANIMFGFKDVLWMNCKSPCFLRDLDADLLFDAIRRLGSEVKLVVCEDVPCLDDLRADVFSGLLDELLALGYEAIVTCTPSADTFSCKQRDRMTLSGADLLLSDEELGALIPGSRYDIKEHRELPLSLRIPCLHWHDKGSEVLLQGIASEDLPNDVLLGMLVLLALGSGAVDDMQAFLSIDRAQEICSIISESYPFFGMDGQASMYRSLDVSVGQISSSFGSKISLLASSSICDGKDVLICRLSDMMLERGLSRRACELMCEFAPKPVAASWLIRVCLRLVDRGEAYPIAMLHDAVRRGGSGQLDSLSICRAWAAVMMGDVQNALLFCRRVVRSGSSTAVQKSQAICFILATGGQEDAPKMAYKLRQLLGQLEDDSTAMREDDGLYANTAIVSKFMLCLEDGMLPAADYWGELRGSMREDTGMEGVLLFCSGVLMRRLSTSTEDGVSGVESNATEEASLRSGMLASMSSMCGFCNEVIDGMVAGGNWFAVFAAQGMMQVLDRWPMLVDLPLSDKLRESVRHMSAHIAEQCKEYGVSVMEAEAKQREYNITHPDPFRMSSICSTASTPDPSVPTLTVNLFGGLEVLIGGKPLEPGKLTRMKAKTLLALLVINRGKEITRQRLSEILWPDVGFDAYRRNFYSIWSQLKQSLSVMGSCPYLIRSQVGCSVDTRLVTSDVYDYERVCRTLLFGSEDAGSWEQLYSCVCGRYSGKLMPCETENATLASLRSHYHAQLIDGLIAASARLVSMNEPRGALWFAREAARREEKREDVFIALMEAQIASDQRSAALETYFECRKFLREGLGIDPSARLVGLYRSIIETEDAF